MRAGVSVLHLHPDYFCPAALVARLKFDSVANKETVSAVDYNHFSGLTGHSINDRLKNKKQPRIMLNLKIVTVLVQKCFTRLQLRITQLWDKHIWHALFENISLCRIPPFNALWQSVIRLDVLGIQKRLRTAEREHWEQLGFLLWSIIGHKGCTLSASPHGSTWAIRGSGGPVGEERSPQMRMNAS